MTLYSKAGTKDGLILRGRDVAFELAGVDLDPKVKALMTQVAEIQFEHSKAIADMATMFEQMMTLLTTVTNAQGNMATEVERFRRKYAQDDPAPNLTSFPNQERRNEDGD